MELSWIILQQTLRMALYMLLGYLLYKKIGVEGSRTLANLLLWLIIPSTILNSFCVEYTAERMGSFLISFLLGGLTLAVSLTTAKFLFPRSGVDQFAATFSNAGYIGIPLIQASFGSEAVFYLVGIVLLLNFLQWTYGASIIQKGLQADRKPAAMMSKDMLLNPITISAIMGVCVFLSGIGDSLPGLIGDCIDGVAAMNAPLAMIVLGVYLAQTDVRSLLTDLQLYRVSAVRLILIPLLVLVMFAPLPVDGQMRMTILIAIAAPVGANVAVYSQIYGADYTYACKTVTHSTIWSILVMPLFIAIARALIDF